MARDCRPLTEVLLGFFDPEVSRTIDEILADVYCYGRLQGRRDADFPQQSFATDDDDLQVIIRPGMLILFGADRAVAAYARLIADLEARVDVDLVQRTPNMYVIAINKNPEKPYTAFGGREGQAEI